MESKVRTYDRLRMIDLVGKEFIPRREQVESFMSKNGLRFPDDYLDFLTTTNGGTIWTEQTVTFRAKFKLRKETIELRQLYPLTLGRGGDLVAPTWRGNLSIRPRFLFEIGSTNRNGVYVCMVACGEAGLGGICCYDSNQSKLSRRSGYEDLLTDHGCAFVADCFGEFIGQLVIEEAPWKRQDLRRPERPPVP